MKQAKRVFKDYYLTKSGLLYKSDMDDKHLMGKFGRVPCIDADNVWDRVKGKVNDLKFSTRKGKEFRTTRDVFEKHKEEFNFGFGRQYYIPREFWEIRE